jgi:hypothetical protein
MKYNMMSISIFRLIFSFTKCLEIINNKVILENLRKEAQEKMILLRKIYEK